MKRVKWMSYIVLFLISVMTLNSILIKDSYATSKKDSSDEESGNGNQTPSVAPGTDLDDTDPYTDTEIGKAINVLDEIEPTVELGEELNYTVTIKKDHFENISGSLGGEEEKESLNTKSRYYNLLSEDADTGSNKGKKTPEENKDQKDTETPEEDILSKEDVKKTDEEYKKIRGSKSRLSYIFRHKLMKGPKRKKKKLFNSLKKLKVLLGYIDLKSIEALKKGDSLSEIDKKMLSSYGLVKGDDSPVTGFVTYYNGLEDMSPYAEITEAMGDSYNEVFKDETRLKNYKTQVKKLYKEYIKFLTKNLKVEISKFEKEKDIEIKIYIQTEIKRLSVITKDFLNKKKIEGLNIEIDKTFAGTNTEKLKTLADNGLIVAKLTLKGNQLIKGKVRKAIRMFEDLTVAPAEGSYLKEFYDTLAPPATTGVTQTNDFASNQTLVLRGVSGDTLVDEYLNTKQNAMATPVTAANLGIQTISIKFYNKSLYLYILFKTANAGSSTIAQQIGIDHLTGTGKVTFQTTNIKTLAGTSITFDTATALTDTPTYGSEVTCAAADLDTLKTCFSNNEKLVVTTLPFEFFAPATVSSGAITFVSVLDYLVLLKKFAMSYVTVMGTMPEDSTMGLINKAIPSGTKTDYQEVTEVDTNFVATTAKHASYTGAYGADDDAKRKNIVLSLKKFKR